MLKKVVVFVLGIGLVVVVITILVAMFKLGYINPEKLPIISKLPYFQQVLPPEPLPIHANNLNVVTPMAMFWPYEGTLTISGITTDTLVEDANQQKYVLPVKTKSPDGNEINLILSFNGSPEAKVLTLKLPGGHYPTDKYEWIGTDISDLSKYLVPGTQIIADVEASQSAFVINSGDKLPDVLRITIPVPAENPPNQ